MSHRRRARLIVVTVSVVLCGSCAPAAQQADETDPVVARYRDYWSAMEQVTSSATADLGQLNEVCRGTQLRSLTEGWTRSRAHGIVSVGSVKSNVVEAKISNDRAYLVDELDLSHWLLAHGETGAPVEGQYVNPECAAYEVVLAKDDGQWFVTEIADLGPCG